MSKTRPAGRTRPGLQAPRVALDRRGWKALLRTAKKVRTLPRRGMAFMFIPGPDGGAEGTAFCREQGPEVDCFVKPVPQPGGAVAYECHCKGPKPSPKLPGIGSSPASCQFVSTTRAVRCFSVDCAGRCEMQLVEKTVLGRRLFFAVCVCSQR